MAPEKFLVQPKLGIQVLLFGRLINDHNQARRRDRSLRTPLGKHRVHHQRIDAGCIRRPHRELRHACALGLAEQGIEQRTARIGIDLDQPRTLGSEMEIETQQATWRAWIKAGDLGRPGQNRRLIGRQRRNLFNGGNHACHLFDVLPGYVDRQRRKQVRMGFSKAAGQALGRQQHLEFPAQCGRVYGDAVTALVQVCCRRGWRTAVGAWG